MLIVSEAAVSQVIEAMVMATHSAVTIQGKPYFTGTIDPSTLRAAALAALGVICKTPVDTLGPDALPPQT